MQTGGWRAGFIEPVGEGEGFVLLTESALTHGGGRALTLILRVLGDFITTNQHQITPLSQ